MGPSTITSENTNGTISNNIREHRWVSDVIVDGPIGVL
jgi:hypothetical protein